MTTGAIVKTLPSVVKQDVIEDIKRVFSDIREIHGYIDKHMEYVRFFIVFNNGEAISPHIDFSDLEDYDEGASEFFIEQMRYARQYAEIYFKVEL